MAANVDTIEIGNLVQRRMAEFPRYASLEWAFKLKMLLEDKRANIVTAESLTAGLILKTLVDVPMQGATLYGGFGVYDTDAKRLWLGVTTEGVYGEKTARQMAEGALENSRAVVSLAVTGDAMPYPEAKERIGDVYIGVSIRTGDGTMDTFTKSLASCDSIREMCDGWKQLTVPPNTYAPTQMTAVIADYIRELTTKEALEFCYQTVKNYQGNTWKESIDGEVWDKDCRAGSWILDAALKIPTHVLPGLAPECDAESMDDLSSMMKEKERKKKKKERKRRREIRKQKFMRTMEANQQKFEQAYAQEEKWERERLQWKRR
uniref:Competence-damaged protein n=1 Tax=Marseillevirus LCMAC101 TaxID=2506602 RepID=A0A481YR20_9VIRU|nr:MAG: competence-damaged protein [Marseillevirus LCMAC101]